MPHNVEQVAADIEDVKDDLHDNVENAGRSAMNNVLFDAIGYVEADADWTGRLRKSLSLSVTDRGDQIEFNVHTDADLAPHAPFVEFGTGSKGGKTTFKANSAFIPASWPDTGSAVPVGFPYSAPGMHPGLVESIIDWVETKPITPRNGDMSDEQLGYVIAAEIAEEGTYAHPFLRPAWFDNELVVEDSMKTAVRNAFS